MIYLDDKADTFPDGLKGTPFEIVYKALRKVASDVWAVDPTVYRAGMGWGWSALQTPEDLARFREILINALISAFAPLVKDNQTNAELVEYLRQWREYTPTFPRLQALYALFGVTADIQPISDPESQSVMPVTDTIHAFYVRITPTDMARLLTLSEAYKIAVGASPLGSRPYVYYALESDIDTTASPVPVDEASTVFIVNDELASDPPEPPVSAITGYFNAGQGNDQMSVPYSWGPGGDNYEGIYPLDSDQGVRYDPLKVYTVKSVFYADGRQVTDEWTLNRSVQLMNSPFVSGWLVIRTRTNNQILGNPCGCTYEEEENPDYIEILFNLTYTGDPQTFGTNDYWASNIRNNNDLQTLQDFGVNILNSSGSNPDRVSSSNSNFTFIPIGLYGASGEDLGADMSNFYCAQGPSGDWASCICIRSRNAYSTGVYTWKCRITKNS